MIIRDPVYNYIYLTSVEAKIVDHPLFQRLRFISQNGTAYLTYPSNKSCRFLHSIGTMEVAGRIALNVFNSNRTEVSDFLEAFFSEASTHVFQRLLVKPTQLVKTLSPSDKEFFSSSGCELVVSEIQSKIFEGAGGVFYKKMLAKVLVLQSLRLAGLLHDLGHLPFSHTLENAFEPSDNEALKGVYSVFSKKLVGTRVTLPIHERIGIVLLDCILPEDGLSDFEKCCRVIAKDILSSKKEPETSYEKIIHTLHGIIAGELDADRLDYCSRDPKFSGMELGAFDLYRIINNLVLVKTSKDDFEILPTPKALSAIESFFHQRYLIYKYLIYHHSKVRMDAIIKEIVKSLSEFYFNNHSPEIRNILKSRRFDYLWNHCNDDDYFSCTEYNLVSIMTDITYIPDIRKSKNEKIKVVVDMIDTFLKRETANMLSLLKRVDSYNEFVKKIAQKISQETEITTEFIKALPVNDNMFEEIYKDYGIIVLLEKIKPKTIFNSKDNITLKVSDGNNLINIGELSSYLSSLKNAASMDQQFHVFLWKKDIRKNGIKTDEIVDKIVDILASNIIKNVITEEY